MKVAVVQNSLNTAIGTQDITDSSISSDLLLAMNVLSTPVTAENDTNKARARLSLGFSDMTNNAAWGYAADNGVAGGASSNYISGTLSALEVQENAVATRIELAHSSSLSNGERINISKTNASARLMNTMFISGSDIERSVTTFTLSSVQTTKTITHGLTGTPQMMYMIVVRNLSAIPNGRTAEFLHSMWDGTNSVGLGFQHTSASNPTTVAARLTADAGHMISGDTDVFTMSFSSVGATTVDINRTVTNSVPVYGILVSLRYTGAGTFAAQAVQGTLPTGTGTFTPFTGMAVAPQASIIIATRLTATTLATDDTAGALSIGFAANNGGTQQAVAATTDKDAVATSVTASQTSNAKCIRVLDNTGATAFDAGVSTWNSGGITYNATTASGTAYEYIGIAFGATSSSSGGVRGGTFGGFSELSGGFRN